MPGFTRKGVATAAAIASVLLVMSGCSSGSTASTTTTSGSAAAGSAAGVADAKATVEKYSQPITSIGITEPLQKLPTGKTAVYVGPQAVATVAEISAAIAEAGSVLGMDKVTIIDGGFSPDKMEEGLRGAIGLKPDLLIMNSFPPSQFANILDPYRAGGGKIIGVSLGTPGTDLAADGVDAEFGSSTQNGLVARAQADWIIADSNGTAHMATVGIPIGTGPLTTEAVKDQITTKCPNCTYAEIGVQATDTGTVIPGQIVTFLQSHPDVTYLNFAYGDLVLGVPAALQAAGLDGKVKIVSGFGSKSNFQYIVNGEEAAEMGSPAATLGWLIADAGARILAGQKVPVVEPFGQPFQFLTKETLTFDPEQPWVAPTDYQAQFKKIWGVQ